MTNTAITYHRNTYVKPENKLDQNILEAIDNLVLNDQLTALKEICLNSTPALATERRTRSIPRCGAISS